MSKKDYGKVWLRKLTTDDKKKKKKRKGNLPNLRAMSRRPNSIDP